MVTQCAEMAKVRLAAGWGVLGWQEGVCFCRSDCPVSTSSGARRPQQVGERGGGVTSVSLPFFSFLSSVYSSAKSDSSCLPSSSLRFAAGACNKFLQ